MSPLPNYFMISHSLGCGYRHLSRWPNFVGYGTNGGICLFEIYKKFVLFWDMIQRFRLVSLRRKLSHRDLCILAKAVGTQGGFLCQNNFFNWFSVSFLWKLDLRELYISFTAPR